MAEASAHYEMALETLAHLPPGEARDRHEMAIVMALGNALIASRGYTAERTGQAFDRARTLCEQYDDTANLIRVAHGQWSFHLMRSEIPQATSVAHDLYRRYLRTPNNELGIAAHRLAGISLLQVGGLAAAQDHLETAGRMLDEGGLDVIGGRDSSVAIPAYLSIVLALRGRYQEAQAQRRRALDIASGSSNPHRLAFALGVATIWFHVILDDGKADVDGFAAVTEERDFPFWRGFAVAHRGIAVARGGDIATGFALVREGEAIHREMGTYWGIPQSLGSFARFLPNETGLRIAREALAELDRTEVRWFAPELQRIHGDLLLTLGRRADAERVYRRALAEAQDHGARHWELKIALSLAGLLRATGRSAEVRALVNPFEDGFLDQTGPEELTAARNLLAPVTAPLASD